MSKFQRLLVLFLTAFSFLSAGLVYAAATSGLNPDISPPQITDGSTPCNVASDCDALCIKVLKEQYPLYTWPNYCRAYGYLTPHMEGEGFSYNEQFDEMSANCTGSMYVNRPVCVSHKCTCVYYDYKKAPSGKVCRTDSFGKAFWGDAQCTNSTQCLKPANECVKSPSEGYNIYSSSCVDCGCKKKIDFFSPCSEGYHCETDAEHVAAMLKGKIKLKDYSTLC